MRESLQRTRATREQSHTQSALQRMENLRGAFAPRPGGIAGRQVWLVDDVCTTGATLKTSVDKLTADFKSLGLAMSAVAPAPAK